MALPATPFTPLADFHWMLETQPNARMEWVDGEIVAMGKTSRNHGLISQRLSRIAGNELFDRGCRVFLESMELVVDCKEGEAHFFPDLVAICGPEEYDRTQRGDVLTNPTAVVEVLSPSTRAYDFKTKVPFYQQLPSLKLIWVLEQEPYKLYEYRRLMGGPKWVLREITDPATMLDSLGIEFTLGDVYAYVVE